MLKRFTNRRGLGPFTLPEIVLYVVAAIAMLIFVLVLMGYAGSTVPRMVIVNEEQMLSNYMADAMVTLPNWDGECGCLAKSSNITGKEVIYPGLLPKWKLDKMTLNPNCNEHICMIPFFIDETAGAAIHVSVTDIETNTALMVVGQTSFKSNTSVTRLVAIEYPNGIVHAGRLVTTVFH